jgi:hypothetical protein
LMDCAASSMLNVVHNAWGSGLTTVRNACANCVMRLLLTCGFVLREEQSLTIQNGMQPARNTYIVAVYTVPSMYNYPTKCGHYSRNASISTTSLTASVVNINGESSRTQTLSSIRIPIPLK